MTRPARPCRAAGAAARRRGCGRGTAPVSGWWMAGRGGRRVVWGTRPSSPARPCGVSPGTRRWHPLAGTATVAACGARRWGALGVGRRGCAHARLWRRCPAGGVRPGDRTRLGVVWWSGGGEHLSLSHRPAGVGSRLISSRGLTRLGVWWSGGGEHLSLSHRPAGVGSRLISSRGLTRLGVWWSGGMGGRVVWGTRLLDPARPPSAGRLGAAARRVGCGRGTAPVSGWCGGRAAVSTSHSVAARTGWARGSSAAGGPHPSRGLGGFGLLVGWFGLGGPIPWRLFGGGRAGYADSAEG